MSDQEFWLSTMAKVTALYQTQREWDRRRDYFPAHLWSAFLASKGVQGDHGQAITGEDLLAPLYPRYKTADAIDPDRGASGDWQALKAALKTTTDERHQKLAKLVPFIP